MKKLEIIEQVYEYLYQQFPFYEKETLKQLIVTCAEDIIASCNNEKDFQILLSKKCTLHIYKYLCSQFKNGNFCNIVKKLISIKVSSKNIKNEFDAINSIISKTEYNPSFEEFLDIANMDIVKEYIDKLVIKYKNNILKQDYAFLKDNQLLKNVIETYCLSNELFADEIENNYSLELTDYNDDNYTENSVQIFLNEIGKYPLLTREEEYELVILKDKGDMVAKEKLINSNLRLVVAVAKKYYNRGLPLLDLIQDGSLGLMKAVDRFNPKQGYRLSTFAVWWIRQSIIRSIDDTGRNIRIPVYMHEKLNKFRRCYGELSFKLNREPTLEEISKALGISQKKAKEYKDLLTDTVSIYSPVGEEDSMLEDLIPDNKGTPEEQVLKMAFPNEIRQLLEESNLKPRERSVIIYRFGLDKNNPETMTLEDVGKIYNITKERVRQIEQSALNKLRKSKQISYFVQYMDNPERALQNIQTIEDKNPKKQPKRTRNIYKYFYDYTEDEIDAALRELSESEMQLLYLRFGADLKKPVYNKNISKNEKEIIYDSIFPKIKRILDSKKSLCKYIKEESSSNLGDTDLVNSSIIIKKIKENKDSSIDNYTRILEIFNMPEFKEITKNRDILESMILSLQLENLDNKHLLSQSIADYLGMEISEVNEITKKVLLEYKEKLNQMEDYAQEEKCADMSSLYEKVKKKCI